MLNQRQRIAFKYYCAYSALCHSVDEGITGADALEMQKARNMLFAKYKEYDPDNSFDLRLTYNLVTGEVVD